MPGDPELERHEQAELDGVQSRRISREPNNGFNATITATVGFNQTAPVFGQAYESPLGSSGCQVGVNMPIVQWGAGRADVEAAKAGTAGVASNKTARDASSRTRGSPRWSWRRRRATCGLGEGRHGRGQTVRGREQPLHDRQDRHRQPVLAQNEKDDAVLAHVQALRGYWAAYYRLRRVTLYDFAAGRELAYER